MEEDQDLIISNIELSPGQILAVGLVIFILFLSILQLGAVFKAGLTYEMGCIEENRSNYRTAVRHFEKALEWYPTSAVIGAHITIAAFKNEDIDKTNRYLKTLSGKGLPSSLNQEIQRIAAQMTVLYYPSAALKKILDQYGQEELEQTLEALMEYIAKNPSDILGYFYTANLFYDLEDYKEAKKYYNKVAAIQPEFLTAQINLAATHRELAEYEAAIEIYNQILKRDKQYTEAYIGLSKTAFRQNQKEEGLALALEAYRLEQTDADSMVNLALAYHYNHRFAERDLIMKKLTDQNYNDLDTLKRLFQRDFE